MRWRTRPMALSPRTRVKISPSTTPSQVGSTNPTCKHFGAATRYENDGEFFAEMTAAYFCVPTEATYPVLHCAGELQAYDPATYEVIHAIYRGSTDLRTLR